MNIFEMSQSDFDNWINSSDGEKFLENLLDYIEKNSKEDEFYFAKECWKWDCPYNSNHIKRANIEMGHYTVCHKFKNEEHNDCKERETWFYEESE